MRKWGIVLLLVGLVISVVPAGAQGGGFTEEEQAALDDIEAAVRAFAAATTFSADLIQGLDQNITVGFQGQSVNLIQAITSDGTLQVQRVEGYENANRSMDFMQTVSQTISGMGQDQENEIGPYQFGLIVFEDRIYMNMQMPPELAGTLPEGWQDVTDGAEAYGMNMYNIQQMTRIEGKMDEAYFTSLFEAVTGVDVLGSEDAAGQTVNRYRLTLDPALALQTIGAENIEQMFNASAVPFDIPKLVDLMYTDPDTTYVVEVAVGAEDQALYEFVYNIFIDIAFGSELITDQSLQGAEIEMVQTVSQTFRPSGLDEPVTIEAPVLSE